MTKDLIGIAGNLCQMEKGSAKSSRIPAREAASSRHIIKCSLSSWKRRMGKDWGWMSLLVILSTSAAALPLNPLAAQSTTKIMPLGDSITESSVGHASYRYWLWKKLVGGKYNVDFVGSRTGVYDSTRPPLYQGQPLYTDFDQNHEGHWGWRADQILSYINGWANSARPDVVMIHLGTNDIWQNQSNSSTINEIGQIIDALRRVNPNIKILLAKLIPSTYKATEIQNLNNLIPSLASQKNTRQSPVIVVDQWTGFNANAGSDTWDGGHPNESGEKKIADKWYSSITRYLRGTRQ